MLLLNQFGRFSDSWHVAVNSDVKHTMHSMGVHDVGIHDMGMHDVTVHEVAVHDVGVPGMAMPSMDFNKMWTFFSGKELIFDAHLGKNANFSLLYVSE